MLASAVFAFLHHVLIIVMIVALSTEFALFSRSLSVEHARRIQRADRLYGATAVALFVIGFARVLNFEKSASYYFGNVFFLLKLALFVAVALLSIYPTVRFLKWRKDTASERTPVVSDSEFRAIRIALHWQLLGVVLIALCAALMARGIG